MSLTKELPSLYNNLAERVKTRTNQLANFVQHGDPGQFLGACILEANSLSLTLEEHEINDKRTVTSFIRSCFNCAVVGLTPGDALGHAYFVPFNRKGQVQGEFFKEINLIVGYKGYCELAWRSGFLDRISPEYVLQGESVERVHEQTGPRIRHIIPCPGRPKPSKDNIEAAYISYSTTGGSCDLVMVEKWDLANSENKGGPIWKYNYPAMALKTAVLRASKRWRLSQEMAQAVMLDEQSEREEAQAALVPEAEAVDDLEPIDFNDFDVQGENDGDTVQGENDGDDDTVQG